MCTQDAEYPVFGHHTYNNVAAKPQLLGVSLLSVSCMSGVGVAAANATTTPTVCMLPTPQTQSP